MFNPLRAETSLVLNGKPYDLRLNLKGLAVLEAGLGASSLMDLVRRFETMDFGSEDLILILNSALYGAGHRVSVENCQVEGGAKEAANAAMKLLSSALGYGLVED